MGCPFHPQFTPPRAALCLQTGPLATWLQAWHGCMTCGALAATSLHGESCLSTVCAAPVPPVNVHACGTIQAHTCQNSRGKHGFAFHTELPALLVLFFTPFLKILDGGEFSHRRRDCSQLGSETPPSVALTVFPPWGALLKPCCPLDGTYDSSLRAFSSSPPLPGRPPSSRESSLAPLAFHSPLLIVSGLSLNRCKDVLFSFLFPKCLTHYT